MRKLADLSGFILVDAYLKIAAAHFHRGLGHTVYGFGYGFDPPCRAYHANGDRKGSHPKEYNGHACGRTGYYLDGFQQQNRTADITVSVAYRRTERDHHPADRGSELVILDVLTGKQKLNLLVDKLFRLLRAQSEQHIAVKQRFAARINKKCRAVFL